MARPYDFPCDLGSRSSSQQDKRTSERLKAMHHRHFLVSLADAAPSHAGGASILLSIAAIIAIVGIAIALAIAYNPPPPSSDDRLQ